MRYTGWLGDQKTTTQQALQPARRATPTTSIYNTRLPTSSRRYHQPIRREKPPTRRHRTPWPVFISIGVIGTLIIIFMSGVVSSWWSNHQADSEYGYPRTYQIDAAVGHNDSEAHPSHFIFLNLHGHIEIIEISGGDDPEHGHIYMGPTLLGPEPDKKVVTGSFSDETGLGTIDMVVIVGGQRIVFLNDGKEFKQQMQ